MWPKWEFVFPKCVLQIISFASTAAEVAKKPRKLERLFFSGKCD